MIAVPAARRQNGLSLERVLVTGAQGFCGRILTRHLEADGIEVHRLTRRPRPGECWHELPEISARALAAVIERVRPDQVFHLAGTTVDIEVSALYAVNVGYAAALLEGLALAGGRACPVLMVGSAAEYGAVDAAALPICEHLPPVPFSQYGASKLAQTVLAQTAARQGRPVMVARPFNIIGPGMPAHIALHTFARQAVEIVRRRRPSKIEVGSLAAARDLVDVEDAVDAYRSLLGAAAWGEVVNVCTGRAVSMATLLDRLLSVAGINAEIHIDLARTRSVDVPVHYGSIEKFQRLAGWVPSTDLDETLGRVWRHAMETMS